MRKSQRLRHQRNREAISAIKMMRGCIDCGYADHPAALDFDHVRGVKQFGVGSSMQRALLLCLEEALKCEVRCANCHRIKTEERRNGHQSQDRDSG